jgi:hypothetical protein
MGHQPDLSSCFPTTSNLAHWPYLTVVFELDGAKDKDQPWPIEPKMACFMEETWCPSGEWRRLSAPQTPGPGASYWITREPLLPIFLKKVMSTLSLVKGICTATPGVLEPWATQSCSCAGWNQCRGGSSGKAVGLPQKPRISLSLKRSGFSPWQCWAHSNLCLWSFWSTAEARSFMYLWILNIQHR